MTNKFLHHGPCIHCGSADNVAWYEDAQGIKSGYCFGVNCGHYYKGEEMKAETFSTKEIDTAHIKNAVGKYLYRNLEGEVIKIIYRIDVDGKKRFSVVTKQNGEIVFKDNGIKSLYNAHLLLNNKLPVIVVEGEKAADAAMERLKDVVAITWQGGAGAVEKGDWSLLTGREVFLVPDNDEVGLAAMKSISTMISSPTIYLCNTSHFPPKGDLADDDVTDEMMYTALEDVTKVGTAVNKYTLELFLKEIKNYRGGIPFNIKKLDDSGLRIPENSVTTIHGRTSHGKTSFMMALALAQLRHSIRRVHFFSLEMSPVQMLLKFIVAEEPIESVTTTGALLKIHEGKHLKSMATINDYIESGRLILLDHPASINKICEYINTATSSGDIVFIDYAQYIKASDTNSARYQQLKTIFEDLQTVAKNAKVAVITGAQVTSQELPPKIDEEKQESYTHDQESYHLSDVPREGKDIDNASALVLKFFNKSSANARGAKHNTSRYNATINVLKNRYGDIGQEYHCNLIKGEWLVFDAKEDIKVSLDEAYTQAATEDYNDDPPFDIDVELTGRREEELIARESYSAESLAPKISAKKFEEVSKEQLINLEFLK
jgi:hypothetical protein